MQRRFSQMAFNDIIKTVNDGVKSIVNDESVKVSTPQYGGNTEDNHIGDRRKKTDKFRTLDNLKMINKSAYYTNPYYVHATKQEIKFNRFQHEAIKVWELDNNNKYFYKDVIFADTINLMTSTVATEVLADIKVLINDEEVNELYVNNRNLKLIIDNIDMEQFVRMGLKYSKVGLKVNIVNGEYTFEYLEPFKYNKRGTSVEIFQFKNGELTKEVRMLQDGLLMVNDNVSEQRSLLFYEFDFRTYTLKGIEKIFEFDILRSEVTKETLKSSSKVFGNNDYFLTNPINEDFIQTLDIPDSMKLDEDARNTMLTVTPSAVSLTEKIQAANQKGAELVQGYKISKKVLGLDNSDQDFASSLRYENDMTAKTINAIRSKFAKQLERVLILLSGQNIEVQAGRYKLESSEAKADLNAKCAGFLSLRDQIAQYLDLPNDDEKVLLATWRSKNDKGITPDYIEEEAAIKAGLLPSVDLEDYTMSGDNNATSV